MLLGTRPDGSGARFWVDQHTLPPPPGRPAHRPLAVASGSPLWDASGSFSTVAPLRRPTRRAQPYCQNLSVGAAHCFSRGSRNGALPTLVIRDGTTAAYNTRDPRRTPTLPPPPTHSSPPPHRRSGALLRTIARIRDADGDLLCVLRAACFAVGSEPTDAQLLAAPPSRNMSILLDRNICMLILRGYTHITRRLL